MLHKNRRSYLHPVIAFATFHRQFVEIVVRDSASPSIGNEGEVGAMSAFFYDGCLADSHRDGIAPGEILEVRTLPF